MKTGHLAKHIKYFNVTMSNKYITHILLYNLCDGGDGKAK